MCCRWATESNPNGIWTPAISNTTMLLHFAYATQKDVADRKTRHCPPDLVTEARKSGDAKKVGGCDPVGTMPQPLHTHHADRAL